MKCPFCAHEESKVTDSRTSAAQDVIRRRRECEACGRRFTTYERVEEVMPLVVKKDGRREPYDRQKIMGGLVRASEKRAVPISRVEELVDALERELIDMGEKEVPSHTIGERVMVRLRALDEIAYVRFASVYRSFRDLSELRDELDKLAEQKKDVPG
ncbi:MAG: transcriptional repressor NrdR [Polyangiaceae bacterium]|nr:transcriptional repressor NrdR [Polyangiaceae bacterium]